MDHYTRGLGLTQACPNAPSGHYSESAMQKPLCHNPEFAMQKYLLLHNQHEELRQHLYELCPSYTTSPSVSPSRSFGSSSPELSPTRERRRSSLSSLSSAGAPHRGPGSPLEPVLDETLVEEMAAGEQKLFDVNESIKRALTELLNCDTVRRDSAMRTWVQSRLMETQQELRRGRRRRSNGSPAALPDDMSVLLETSAGDIVVDLLTEFAPRECENFLKLCKLKYYNFSPVHSVQQNFSFQTGDPLGPAAPASDGGSSVWGLLSGPSRQTFPATLHPKLKHLERGTVSMATTPHPSDPDVRLAASQFIVTLDDGTDHLDGRASIFAKVVEGFDALEKINGAITDGDGRPLVDIRIKHTIVLDDPYDDPPGLRGPSQSPPPSAAQLATVRIADDAVLDEEVDEEAAERTRRERDARAQALTLEMMGDLPFAEVRPPENVLFVCKLNPVTTDADLELIFSRFGTILSCEVIRDKKTGDSLQYAFVEFEDKAACEGAYFKMQGVLIDDRRIHVDFSQSVSKLADVWRGGENAKRQRKAGGGGGGGGWGGVRGLEKWRQYRADDGRAADDDHYAMVHGEEEMRGRYRRGRDGGDGGDGGGGGGGRGDRQPGERPRDAGRDAGGTAGRDPRGDERHYRERQPRRSRSRSPRRDAPRGGGRYDDRRQRQGRSRDRDRERDRQPDHHRYRGR
ncbi:hypothetical protein GGR56DRAFT_667447 [Xylariaceae sp. FL0804]|nr:hypothetical protein GGR56DRAFT_667447 [Xylariaceae sp. FL0804]